MPARSFPPIAPNATMSSTEFDAKLHLVTSYLLSPVQLAFVRSVIAVYVLVTLVFILVWEGTKTKDIDSYVAFQATSISWSPQLIPTYPTTQIFLLFHELDVDWHLRVLFRFWDSNDPIRQKFEIRRTTIPLAKLATSSVLPPYLPFGHHYYVP
jgi:hypothetical protein